MARSRRGGYRAPSKPAAASGPGSLSKRTDQPVRVAPGGDYGDRKEMVQAQQGAPLPAEGGPAGAGGGAGGRGGGVPPDGIFGPSGRPGEPMTAGVPFGPGDNGPANLVDSDPDMLLRALYAESRHPDLARLLTRADRR